MYLYNFSNRAYDNDSASISWSREVAKETVSAIQDHDTGPGASQIAEKTSNSKIKFQGASHSTEEKSKPKRARKVKSGCIDCK